MSTAGIALALQSTDYEVMD